MPELPEVETTRRALCQVVEGHRILQCEWSTPRLRYPLSSSLKKSEGQIIEKITRRAKHLCFHLSQGYVVVHLGMSGFFRWQDQVPRRHDHVVLTCDSARLIYHDTRRFGAWLWCDQNPDDTLFKAYGPEPLSDAFSLDYCLSHACCRSHRAIKQVVMDASWVVGVGNIYANEALFQAKIHPHQPANTLLKVHWAALREAIRAILAKAIEAGGCSIVDFKWDEQLGYFAQSLCVYGRQDKPCMRCDQPLEHSQLGGRRTVYCRQCQPLI